MTVDLDELERLIEAALQADNGGYYADDFVSLSREIHDALRELRAWRTLHAHERYRLARVKREVEIRKAVAQLEAGDYDEITDAED